MRHCTPLLFGLDLPGCNLFIMDILNAAHSVLSLEAIKMVSCLLNVLVIIICNSPGIILCYDQGLKIFKLVSSDGSSPLENYGLLLRK